MDMTSFSATKRISGSKGYIMTMMEGVDGMIHLSTIDVISVHDKPSAVMDKLVSHMLTEWVVGHERQSQAIAQQCVAQCKVEISVGVSTSHTLIVFKPMLIAAIRHEGMTVIQEPVYRDCHTPSPAMETAVF